MNATLRNILYFFCAVLLGKLLGAATTFCTAKSLQPASYGLWITLQLIASYAPILTFGTAETLLKEVPYFIGRGEKRSAIDIEKGVLGSFIISVVLLLILGTGVAWFFSGKPGESYSILIALMVVAAGFGFFFDFFYYRLTAYQRFGWISFLESTKSAIGFMAISSLSYYVGLGGTVLGYLATEIILCLACIILSIKYCGVIWPDFKFSQVFRMIQIGFPITMFWWLFTFQTSVDRLISMYVLGKTATGHYGLGVAITSVMYLLPRIISRVLYPKISMQLGSKADPNRIEKLVILPVHAIGLMSAATIGLALLLAPAVYHRFFPHYNDGLESFQILVIGSFFRLTIGNGANFLIAKDHQKLLILYVVISSITGIVSAALLLRIGMSINGIALSTVLSGAVLSVLVWSSVFAKMGHSRISICRQVFVMFQPFLHMVVLVCALYMVLPGFLRDVGINAFLHVLSLIMAFGLAVFVNPSLRRQVKDIYWQWRPTAMAPPCDVSH